MMCSYVHLTWLLEYTNYFTRTVIKQYVVFIVEEGKGSTGMEREEAKGDISRSAYLKTIFVHHKRMDGGHGKEEEEEEEELNAKQQKGRTKSSNLLALLWLFEINCTLSNLK